MLTWRANSSTTRSVSAIYRPLDIPSIDVPLSLEQLLDVRDSFLSNSPDHQELIIAIFQSHYKLYELLRSDLSFEFGSVLNNFRPLIKYKHIPIILEASEIEAIDNQYRTFLSKHIFDIDAIVNKPFEPDVVLDKDDFYVDGDYLYFLNNPLQLFSGYYGGSGKYYYVLWLKDVTIIDTAFLSRFFTNLLGFSNTCVSHYYDRFLFTGLAIEIMADGCTPERLLGLVALYYGLPVSIADSEKVLEIQTGSGVNIVVTDKTKYFVPSSFSLAVSVNDKLTKWTPLISNFYVVDLHNGLVPSYLPKLPIYPDGILVLTSAERHLENNHVRTLENLATRLLESETAVSSRLNGVIYAANDTVNTTIVETERGYEISWPLEGNPDDVAAFWDAVRERERTLGIMLYDLLSEHYEDLSTINPAKVMARFFYRSAVVIALPNSVEISDTFISVLNSIRSSHYPILQVNCQ